MLNTLVKPTWQYTLALFWRGYNLRYCHLYKW